MHYIYKITNLINQKVYIGQTKNPVRRWYSHRTVSRNKPKYVINLAMNKYGVDNFSFEVIASCLDQEAVNESEKLIIMQYDSRNKGYNVQSGGKVVSGWHHSEKSKQKSSLSNLKGDVLEAHRIAGKKLLDWREGNGHPKPHLGKKFSDEHRRKLSESHKDKDNHQLGRKHSDETKQKMRLAKQKLKENYVFNSCKTFWLGYQ